MEMAKNPNKLKNREILKSSHMLLLDLDDLFHCAYDHVCSTNPYVYISLALFRSVCIPVFLQRWQ